MESRKGTIRRCGHIWCSNDADDVKPEWLSLAYEAARLLRDRSGVPNLPKSRYETLSVSDDLKRQEDNRVLGAKLVADLERRFPQLRINAQESQ